MSSKTKKIATVVLGLLAAVAWLPQLLRAGRSEPAPVRPEVSNTEPRHIQVGAPTPMRRSEDVHLHEESGSLSVSPDDDPIAVLGDTLRQVEALSGGRARIDLDQLLAAAARAGAGSDTASGGTGLPTQGSPLEPLPGKPDALAEFTATAELRGILHGGSEPIALVDDRIVRSGDMLPGGILVERIDKRGVQFMVGEQRALVELPPFVPRAPSYSSDGSGAAQAGETESTGGAPIASEQGAL